MGPELAKRSITLIAQYLGSGWFKVGDQTGSNDALSTYEFAWPRCHTGGDQPRFGLRRPTWPFEAVVGKPDGFCEHGALRGSTVEITAILRYHAARYATGQAASPGSTSWPNSDW